MDTFGPRSGIVVVVSGGIYCCPCGATAIEPEPFRAIPTDEYQVHQSKLRRKFIVLDNFPTGCNCSDVVWLSDRNGPCIHVLFDKVETEEILLMHKPT